MPAFKDKCPECGTNVDDIDNRIRVDRNGSVSYHCDECVSSNNPVKILKKNLNKNYAKIGEKQL